MPDRIPILKFILVSFVLHIVFFAGMYFLSKAVEDRTPLLTPVQIVNLPSDVSKKLPPITQPAPPREAPPKPATVPPPPAKFGTDEELKLPKTMPPAGKPGTAVPPGREGEKSPLPFLSQADIDALARRGMPSPKPGDESVTLDTGEFKFISYNRWLKIKVESVLRYPEIAARSNMQGVLYIRFDIMKDGSLGMLELLKSSGFKILDDEALRAIRSCAPFQPLPDEWHMDRYSIRAAVIFYFSDVYVR